MNPKLNIVTFLVLCLIGSTLISSNLFVYQTLASFFGLTLYTCLFVLICSSIFFNKKGLTVTWNYTVVAFLIWLFYVILHAIIGSSGNLKDTLLIFSSILFISLSIILSYKSFSNRWLSLGLMIFILFESLVCLIQYINGSSLNSYFKVTGTHVNPNITAMFIAMAFPFLLVVLFKEKRMVRAVGFITMLLSIIALMLLESRTALIGAGIAFLIVAYYNYDWTNILKTKFSKSIFIIVLFLTVSLSIFCIPIFYQTKKASADGRKTIWKISAMMVKENPIKGYGYGLFDRNFNLFQGKYFEAGRGTPEEILNASYIRMAYNEYLENTVEGGVLGSAIFLGIIISIFTTFYNYKEKNLYKIAAFAGTCAFSVMSFVNFTIQAIPVFFLFIIYAVIINPPLIIKTPTKEDLIKAKTFKFTPKIQSYIGVILVCIGLYLGFYQFKLFKGFINHKNAIDMLSKSNVGEANRIFNSLQYTLGDCESYHTQYGRGLLLAGNTTEALSQFEKATNYTYHPDLFINMGICNQNKNNPEEAEKCYKRAIFIMPNRFTPRYYLMKLYLNSRDTLKALKLSNEIMNMKIKVPSKEVDFFRNGASKLIEMNKKNRITKELSLNQIYKHDK